MTWAPPEVNGNTLHPSDEDMETLPKCSNDEVGTAQVCLRWTNQRGVATMPFSLKENEMKENLDIWKFTLDDGDMAEIEKIDKGHHYLRPGDWFGLPLWD